MTWNPRRKTFVTTRPSPAFPAVTEEEDKQLGALCWQLQNVEESNRRIQKEMKKYLEAVINAEKAEMKLTSDLSSSSLCHENSDFRKLVEDYHSVAVKKNEGASELVRITQRTFLEPMKKFGLEFSGLAAALNAHEQLVQEWKNIAARVKKLQGDRMPQTIVKLEREKQNLTAAGEAVSTSHKKLLEELPVFFSKRIDYIQPSLQAIVRAQLDYHGNATKCFTILLSSGPVAGSVQGSKSENLNAEHLSQQVSPSLIPETQFQSIVQSKLAGIRCLSIVKQTG